MLIFRFKISLHLNKKLIFYVNFLNFTKISLKFFQCGGTDRERKKRRLWIEFHCTSTPLRVRCSSTEGPRNSWPHYGQWSRYHITVCQSTKLHMRSIGWHNFLDFIKYRSQIPRRNTIILNFIKALSGTNSCYISTTDFLTLLIYYKLQKISVTWSVECACSRTR